MPRAAPVIRTRRPERGGLVRIRHTLLSTNTSVRKSSTGAQGKQRLSGGELRSWWSSSDTRDDRPHGAGGRPEVSEDVRAPDYLPAERRCQRGRLHIRPAGRSGGEEV